MPAVKPSRPQARQQLQTGTLVNADPASVSRHLSDLATAVQASERRAVDRVRVTVDLVVGDNRIAHGLGRPALGATVTPTTADATFAWALTGGDSRQAVITVVGVPQPRASVEIY
jgi:hypothetical protein